MESDELLRDVYGLNPTEFTIERYRAADQGLNENGRACRVSHKSGNVVCADRYTTYHENRMRAIAIIADVVAQPGVTPIEELIAHYEDECCDFEDGKWMAQAALRQVPAMADGQLRCLVHCLALIVQGTPYRRPKASKVPVRQVEELATWLKRNKKVVADRIQADLNFVTFKFSTSLRTSNLQSGIVKRLYGKLEVRAQYRTDPHVLKRRIAQMIQELAGLDYTPAIYTTSGSSFHNGLEYCVRIVCAGEEDYDTWLRHQNV